MKKIVALILALVMVMGLATVASAATTEVQGSYKITATTDKTDTRTDVTKLTLTSAVAPVDVDEDGIYDEAGDKKGAVAYYTTTTKHGSTKFVQVPSVDKATHTLYLADGITPYMYLAMLPTQGEVYNTGAVVFTDFGKDCNQYKWADVDADETYYMYQGKIYVKSATGSVNFMVGNEFVQADVVTGGSWVAHTPVYTQDKDGTVTAIACSKCDAMGVICANYAALPTAIKNANLYSPVPGSTTKVFYWAAGTVVEAPETDKVESAETFDAGIAMYVGMSVMAAAGSAVVLKKKD